jgi:tetratricopeptide (TPR) repeat protein
MIPWNLRGRVWAAKKEYANARADYEKAVELVGNVPGFNEYRTTLATLLAACPDATVRDGKKSLELAQRAYELLKGPTEMAALAAAHAELGEFDEAVEWQEKAIAVAPKALSDQYRQRLKLYQEKKPYRF